MGFRSMIVTEDIAMEWPEWFRDKYKCFNYPNGKGAITSKFEIKVYRPELFEDIQQALIQQDYLDKIVVIAFHECTGITRIEIGKESIRYAEPAEWREEDWIMHSYCYGCSDL